MADRCRHSTDLPIASFAKGKGYPGSGYVFPEADWRYSRWKMGFNRKQVNLSGPGPFSLNHDTRLQESKILGRWNAFNLNKI